MPITLEGEVNATVTLRGAVDTFTPTTPGVGGCDGMTMDFSCVENSDHAGGSA